MGKTKKSTFPPILRTKTAISHQKMKRTQVITVLVVKTVISARKKVESLQKIKESQVKLAVAVMKLFLKKPKKTATSHQKTKHIQVTVAKVVEPKTRNLKVKQAQLILVKAVGTPIKRIMKAR